MAEYNKGKFFWIKLTDSFLSSDTVDFLMAQKDGANYVVLYQMLCLKTVNNDGILGRNLGEIIVEYDAEKICRDCKYFSIDTVRIALELYKKLGLVYELENGLLRIANFENMIGSKSISAEKKQIQRETRKKLLELAENTEGGQKVDICPLEIDIEKDKDKEIRDRINYKQIKDLYNDICISFPKLTVLSEKRKQAIKARYRTYCLAQFKEMFEKAEASDFLKGANSNDWQANFDWMMKDANFAKILDGNYDNKTTTTNNSRYDFDAIQKMSFDRINKRSG